MTKFFKWGDRDRKNQNYDKEKITITKAGQTYNVYDAIQAANIDTNIYEVMKKYHCMQDEAIELMKSKGGEKGVFLDIRELQNNIKDISDVQKVAQQAQEMFEQLPSEIKNKYGNDLELFLKEKEKENKKETEQKTEQKTEENKEGVKTNEAK